MAAPPGRLPGWLPAVNVVVKGLQRLGVPLGTIHVLTVPGRRSGDPRSTPVSPLTVGGHQYVVAGLPQCDWARNARAAGTGVLRRGRRVQFFVRRGLVRHGAPEEFAAMSDQVAVFRMTPVGPDAPPSR